MYIGACRCGIPERQRQLGTPQSCLNVNELSKWLRNPPAVLPMAATPNADGMYRGMPDLGLSESQISSLVAYLSTLK